MATKAVGLRPVAAIALASLLLLAGCGSLFGPYVREIRETQPDERVETTLTVVEVCYNSMATTPEAVRGKAEEVCVKKGVHAAFFKNTYLQCPLFMPVGANFACR